MEFAWNRPQKADNSCIRFPETGRLYAQLFHHPNLFIFYAG